MDAVSITVGGGWVVAGLAMFGLALPLVRERVGRNALYGIRLRESLRSDDAWFAINRYGGKRLIVWSIPLILVGAVSLFLPLRSHAALTLALGFAPLVFVVIPVVESWRFARRYPPKK